MTEVQPNPVEVKLRSKKKAIPLKKMQIEDKNGENGVTENGTNGDHHQEIQQNGNAIEGLALDTAALLHRTMESLYEINPELEDSHEGGKGGGGIRNENYKFRN